MRHSITQGRGRPFFEGPPCHVPTNFAQHHITAKQSVKQDKPYYLYHKNYSHSKDECKALAHRGQQQ
uniref:Uncharacterized protein n=1 Tax=Romanomermis culicivorax TaxID=13658 RepID=A0A915IEA5_ROMCU